MAQLQSASDVTGIGSDSEALLLIVVGSHLQAELVDRPLAYQLQNVLRDLQTSRQAEDCVELKPVVCTDLWYLNTGELLSKPVIALGSPAINAATAYLGGSLPTAFVMEDRLRIHMNMDGLEARACLWGVDAKSTEAAIDVFRERFAGQFLNTAEELSASLLT